MSSVTSQAVVRRPRAFVRVSGPDAEDYLQRMVSNDVAAADACDALLLTPKARIVAPLRILDVNGEVSPGDELILDGKTVGRITSAVPGIALAYVRTEVPEDAQLQIAAKAGVARLRR